MARRTQSRERFVAVDGTSPRNRKPRRTTAVTTLTAEDAVRALSIDPNAQATLAGSKQRGKVRLTMITYTDPSRIKPKQ